MRSGFYAKNRDGWAVGQERHERFVPRPFELTPHLFDGVGRQPPDNALADDCPLADGLHRIQWDPPPGHGLAADRLEQSQGLPDRRLTDTVLSQLRLERVDHARIQVAQLHSAQPRQDMEIPDRRISLSRRARQFRRRVPLHHSLVNSSSVTRLFFTLASSPNCFRLRISVSKRSASARRSNDLTSSRVPRPPIRQRTR